MNKPIWDLVIEDMRKRDEFGARKYGRPLTAFNGKDALQEAYEEALDLAVYLKQALIERSCSRS
jgi:hypothetical protein